MIPLDWDRPWQVFNKFFVLFLFVIIIIIIFYLAVMVEHFTYRNCSFFKIRILSVSSQVWPEPVGVGAVVGCGLGSLLKLMRSTINAAGYQMYWPTKLFVHERHV